MALSDQIEELAKKHGFQFLAGSEDTQNPTYGFPPAQLRCLVDEVRKQDEALILMLVERLERADKISGYANNKVAIKAGRARLEKHESY